GDGAGIDAVDNVDLTGDQRVQTLRAVADDGDFRGFEMAAALLPIIAVGLLEGDARARIELVEDKGAAAYRLGPIAEIGGNHQQAIVGQNAGKVRVGRVERNLDLVFIALFDVGHALHGDGGARLRI